MTTLPLEEPLLIETGVGEGLLDVEIFDFFGSVFDAVIGDEDKELDEAIELFFGSQEESITLKLESRQIDAGLSLF